jgi:hypothetical protein
VGLLAKPQFPVVTVGNWWECDLNINLHNSDACDVWKLTYRNHMQLIPERNSLCCKDSPTNMRRHSTGQTGKGMARSCGQQHSTLGLFPGTGRSPAPLALRGYDLRGGRLAGPFNFGSATPSPSCELRFSNTGLYHFVSLGRLVLAMSFASLETFSSINIFYSQFSGMLPPSWYNFNDH